ncbi:type 1 glutamine amidotransferase [Luteimonas sp. BDR2-5]|uniref:type 1 glutamine amidotransferase domain-containing protein n=1 Tax=Proluteimonas luteida TaxID=2878685 RepID=UPI001E37056D|nr:type 1 glutamine amidotransferase domain-containing protein [Luteimonas sp. BDR2-5]MCD9028273.1 type 1 glutamine amidotransferase [Luteimonas sp. BDR2-5]
MSNLNGRKIAILASDGFEQSELEKPLAALRQAGATVQVISPDGKSIRGWKDKNWGDPVDADLALADADAASYDALVLPGGVINPDTLRRNPDAVAFIQAVGKSGKPVAAICHGPWLLVEAGLAKGRKVTSWPSLKTDLANAGGQWEDAEVVVDGNIITSRKPDDIPAFNAAIEKALAD